MRTLQAGWTKANFASGAWFALAPQGGRVEVLILSGSRLEGRKQDEAGCQCDAVLDYGLGVPEVDALLPQLDAPLTAGQLCDQVLAGLEW